jgi:uncharacterized protein
MSETQIAPQDTDTPAGATARIATDHAKRYLTQLCKHFEHKLPVTHGDGAGEITFTLGVCTLRADTGVLTLSVSAPDASALPQLQDVVARHLVRFAFREEMTVDWHRA